MASASATFVFRRLRHDDATALATLETRCAGASQWGEAAYHRIGQDGITGWLAAREDEVIGFVLSRVVADEMEILNLAVDPNARRQRIASRLVAHTIANADARAVKQTYLEVRESNAAARAFYHSLDFVEHSRRKAYYSNPVEDAVVLVLKVG